MSIVFKNANETFEAGDVNVVLGCRKIVIDGSKIDVSARECIPEKSGKKDAPGIVCNTAIDVSSTRSILQSGGISSVVTQSDAMDREASPICQSS